MQVNQEMTASLIEGIIKAGPFGSGASCHTDVHSVPSARKGWPDQYVIQAWAVGGHWVWRAIKNTRKTAVFEGSWRELRSWHQPSGNEPRNGSTIEAGGVALDRDGAFAEARAFVRALAKAKAA
jgi:hypothetical protein